MTPPECNRVFVIKSTTSMVFACARVCLFSYFFAKALGGGVGGSRWSQDGPRWSQDEPRWSQDEPRWSQDGRRRKKEEGRKERKEASIKKKEESRTKKIYIP